jgi:hypothetical protein
MNRVSESRAALANGAVLGPYVIGEKIGDWRHGEVYKAFDPRLGRHVAIKVLHLVAKEKRRAPAAFRARDSASFPSALDTSQNICTVFEHGDARRALVRRHGASRRPDGRTGADSWSAWR